MHPRTEAMKIGAVSTVESCSSTALATRLARPPKRRAAPGSSSARHSVMTRGPNNKAAVSEAESDTSAGAARPPGRWPSDRIALSSRAAGADA